MYLLDTNILSELVKKTPNKNLRGKLKKVPSASLYTASICIMELRYGALRRENSGALWSKIQESIVSKLQVLAFGYKDALKAGEVLSTLHSIGKPIGIEDVLIGSIALSNDLIVVTANTKHFSRIPDLSVENWLT
jgi:predicted nucleic acid-binding protein